jgi:hypothetical protein
VLQKRTGSNCQFGILVQKFIATAPNLAGGRHSIPKRVHQLMGYTGGQQGWATYKQYAEPRRKREQLMTGFELRIHIGSIDPRMNGAHQNVRQRQAMIERRLFAAERRRAISQQPIQAEKHVQFEGDGLTGRREPTPRAAKALTSNAGAGGEGQPRCLAPGSPAFLQRPARASVPDKAAQDAGVRLRHAQRLPGVGPRDPHFDRECVAAHGSANERSNATLSKAATTASKRRDHENEFVCSDIVPRARIPKSAE